MTTQSMLPPLTLPGNGKSIFAVGGELKNTFCLTKDNLAFISRDIGNLNDFQTYQHYREAVQRFKDLLKIEPEVIAHDMHPDYMSTRYAATLNDPAGSTARIGVQHHHAHIASCMAEHRLDGEVIGAAFDGTGYGVDGNIWGGEFFAGGYREFKRVYHLRYIPLPGGDKAAQEPWRMAVSYIYQAFGEEASKFTSRWKDSNLIISMIKKRINAPLTSSMGRLFDAVSSIAGICDVNTYEGEAAIKLMNLCQEENKVYPYLIENGIIDVSPMIREIISEKEEPGRIAARFHATIADIVLRTCLRLREEHGINKVVLSGGVFQNKVLSERSVNLLKKHKFGVFTHSRVPPNDGGISLGQAAIAQALVKQEPVKQEPVKCA